MQSLLWVRFPVTWSLQLLSRLNHVICTHPIVHKLSNGLSLIWLTNAQSWLVSRLTLCLVMDSARFSQWPESLAYSNKRLIGMLKCLFAGKWHLLINSLTVFVLSSHQQVSWSNCLLACKDLTWANFWVFLNQVLQTSRCLLPVILFCNLGIDLITMNFHSPRQKFITTLTLTLSTRKWNWKSFLRYIEIHAKDAAFVENLIVKGLETDGNSHKITTSWIYQEFMLLVRIKMLWHFWGPLRIFICSFPSQPLHGKQWNSLSNVNLKHGGVPRLSDDLIEARDIWGDAQNLLQSILTFTFLVLFPSGMNSWEVFVVFRNDFNAHNWTFVMRIMGNAID